MKRNLAIAFQLSAAHNAMKLLTVASFLILLLPRYTFAWGPEGHSIVAEIAQRQLTSEAKALVAKTLPDNASLASISSWADDVRGSRQETYNWHFVDMPMAETKYSMDRDCSPSDKAQKGDCIIAEIARAKVDLHCAADATVRTEALKFLVHFIGDLHQPFHTVLEDKGMNGRNVTIEFKGKICSKDCTTNETKGLSSNLHKVWDSELIRKAFWSWGGYVQYLEDNWLTKADVANIQEGDATSWAEETHKVAVEVFNATPQDNVLQNSYFNQMMPVLDEQLGRAGLRLAKTLNDPVSCH